MLLRSIAAAVVVAFKGVGSAKNALSKGPSRQMSQEAGKQGAEAAKEGVEAAKGAWVKDLFENKLRLLVYAGLGIVLLNAGAEWAGNFYYQKSVLDTLTRGVMPPPQPPPVLPRAELRVKVRAMLQPKEPSSFYHVVTGPAGGGKSTLLREACRELGSGVGYLDVPPASEVDFGRDLGNAFGFRFQEHMTRFNIVSKPILGTQYEDPRSKHPLASVRQSAEALHDAAKEFRQRTGRPFMLVIDSADRLASSEEGERVLGAIRSYARDWAQEGTVVVIFVAHAWETVEKLIGDHPAQSRAAPVLHISDISQNEAVQYLQHLGVQGKQADQCAELAGGSLLLLQRCASMLKAGMAFPDVKRELFDLIEMAYLAAGLLDQTPQRDGGLAAVEAILKSKDGSISAAEWRECVPDRDQQRTLLGKGVLRFDSRSLRFSSNLAAMYAAEQLRSRLPPSVQEQHKQLKRPGWCEEYFEQPLDHTNYNSNAPTWRQRYFVCSSFFSGWDAPLLFYVGNEGNVEGAVNNLGFLWHLTERLGALLVWGEHRYYGHSIPVKGGLHDADAYQYLSMEQALVDYVKLIKHVKADYGMPAAPVAVVGASYGANLAVFLRMKFPNVVHAALASSAPVRAHLIDGQGWNPSSFWQVVTDAADYDCAAKVRAAFAMLFNLSATAEGRAAASQGLRLCDDVLRAEEDASLVGTFLLMAFDLAAMSSSPFSNSYFSDPQHPLPAWPMQVMCDKMSLPGLLWALGQAVAVVHNVSQSRGQCYDRETVYSLAMQTGSAFTYQVCSQFMPSESFFPTNGVSDMFRDQGPFSAAAVNAFCRREFGPHGPLPDFGVVPLLFSPGDLSTASNIILSNGLLDPWSSGGYLRNISATVVALVLEQAGHHVDLYFAHAADPPQYAVVRAQEERLLREWLSGYRQLSEALAESR